MIIFKKKKNAEICGVWVYLCNNFEKKKLHRPGFAWNIFLEVDIRNLAVVNFMKRFNTGFYFINYSFLNYLEL